MFVSVSIDFPSNSQQDAPFYHTAYYYSCADWDALCDHLRDVLWEDILKLGVSAAAASEFQLLVLLPQFIEITFSVCNKKINLLLLK